MRTHCGWHNEHDPEYLSEATAVDVSHCVDTHGDHAHNCYIDQSGKHMHVNDITYEFFVLSKPASGRESEAPKTIRNTIRKKTRQFCTLDMPIPLSSSSQSTHKSAFMHWQAKKCNLNGSSHDTHEHTQLRIHIWTAEEVLGSANKL